MAEQSFNSEQSTTTEKPKYFEDPQKQKIVENVSAKIQREMHQIDIEEPDKSKTGVFKFGTTFENIATEENRLKHTETEKQKQLRELIESMYANAELILGTAHIRPSKPDGVTVSFDENGKLIIEEILEFKSSENAFQHGVDKGQPPKTLKTIGDVVTILNKLISGEKTSNIKPQDSDLSLDRRIKRDGKLQEIQRQILSVINNGDKITYSTDLVYKIIVPRGVQIPQFDPNLLADFGVRMEIVESTFSKPDVGRLSDRLSSITK